MSGPVIRLFGLNKDFLDLVKKEKPEYIFFTLNYDEFCPKTA